MILPKTLQMIVDYCGEECMWLVWKHYAGVHLCIPNQIRLTESNLVEQFGIHYALALTKAFAGETLDIPKFDYVKQAERLERNQKIRQQRQAGASLARIARHHHLTERQVINILNAAKQQQPQGDLFKCVEDSLGHEERALFDAAKKAQKAKELAQQYYEQGYQAGWHPNGIDLKPNRAKQNNEAAWLRGFNQGKRDQEADELRKRVKPNPDGFKKMKEVFELALGGTNET